MKDRPVQLLLRMARNRARRKGLEFTLDRAWVQKRYDIGYCEVTGLAFNLVGYDTRPSWSHPRSPSIDRIDSSGGYTPANCQLVIWQYNCAKGQWDTYDLQELTAALARHWKWE